MNVSRRSLFGIIAGMFAAPAVVRSAQAGQISGGRVSSSRKRVVVGDGQVKFYDRAGNETVFGGSPMEYLCRDDLG